MPQFGWDTDPRYQKAIQKIRRMQPNQKAVFDTALADEHFADKEMKKFLELAKIRAQKDKWDNDIKLRGKEMQQDYELKNRGLDLKERGIGIDAGKVGLGYSALELDASRDAMSRDLARANFGLDRREWDFGRSENNWATGLGIGNMVLGGYLGYQARNAKEAEAMELENIRRRRYGF